MAKFVRHLAAGKMTLPEVEAVMRQISEDLPSLRASSVAFGESQGWDSEDHLRCSADVARFEAEHERLAAIARMLRGQAVWRVA